jgi:hypothetical protein
VVVVAVVADLAGNRVSGRKTDLRVKEVIESKEEHVVDD